MAKSSAGRSTADRPGPRAKEQRPRHVMKEKRNGSLEIFLLGLLSVSIGIYLFLVFFYRV